MENSLKGRKVALVLSSGGARGIAHIGAIECLLSHGAEITAVSGTSMGAMVGAMYASGNLATFKQWLLSLTKRKIYELTNFNISLTHIVSTDKVIDELRTIIPSCRIEQMNIPYSAVATNLKDGTEKVFRRGDMYDAIRSSISVPILFTPQHLEEKDYVDGGLSNPLPLNRVQRTDGDLLVSMNVSGPLMKNPPRRKEQPHYNIPYVPERLSTYIQKKGRKIASSNYFSLMSDISDIMIIHNVRRTLELYHPDINAEIATNLFSAFAYDHADTIIKFGYSVMEKQIRAWEQNLD